MRIHKGTQGDNDEPCRWIEPRTTWQFTLHDLIDGLCSHYWRNRTADDEQLPEALSFDQIIGTVKQEFQVCGTDNVWTWSEQTPGDYEEAQAWARGIVLAVLPKLDVDTPWED